MTRDIEEFLYVFLLICCPGLCVVAVGLLTHPIVGIGLTTCLLFAAFR